MKLVEFLTHTRSRCYYQNPLTSKIAGLSIFALENNVCDEQGFKSGRPICSPTERVRGICSGAIAAGASLDARVVSGAFGCGSVDRKTGGRGRPVANPHLLIRPFVKREAVLSSKIEGTQATLGELLAAEAGVAVDRSPEDLREVGNYVVALEHGIVRLRELPLCVRIIRELQEKLMTGVRGHQASPGRFRKIQNWIGRAGSTPATASFVPPPPDEVEGCLAAWERFI